MYLGLMLTKMKMMNMMMILNVLYDKSFSKHISYWHVQFHEKCSDKTYFPSLNGQKQ